MTQDELISIVKDAGCPDVYIEWAKSDWSSIKGLIVPMTVEQLSRFAKLVAAKEREACAEICDDWANGWSGEPEMAEMADEIRARGNA